MGSAKDFSGKLKVRLNKGFRDFRASKMRFLIAANEKFSDFLTGLPCAEVSKLMAELKGWL
jgi:hypothetical protein